MASALRSLLQVLLGVVIGFFLATYVLPSARPASSGTTGPGPVARQPSAGPAAPAAVPATEPAGGAESTLFGRRGGQASPGAFSEPRAEAPKPAEPTPVATVQPAPEPAPRVDAPTPVVAEGPVDFRELCIKPAAWPPIITLNKEINAQVMQGEEVIAEIPLAAGEKLQVSKVFGDGTAEVRAKGAKFIVKAADTDLAAQARVRLAEISGRVRAPVATTPPVEPTPAPREQKEPAPAPRRDDLDGKMRSLFGTPEKR